MAEAQAPEREPGPGADIPSVQTPDPAGPARVERRAFERLAPREPLDALLRGRLAAHVLDVSRGGALAEMASPLRPLAATDFSILFEDGVFTVRAIVRRCVAWSFAAGEGGRRRLVYRAAFEFAELSPRDAALLEGNLVFRM